MAPFYSSVSVSRDSEPAYLLYQDPDTETAKWNSANIGLWNINSYDKKENCFMKTQKENVTHYI